MSDTTGIEWTDHTFNPWWGCVRVSPACEHCYAETFAARFGVKWGVKAERKIASEKVWNDPLRWDRAAEKAGHAGRRAHDFAQERVQQDVGSKCRALAPTLALSR